MNAKRKEKPVLEVIKSADALPVLQMDRGRIVSKMGHPFGQLSECSVLFAHELIHRANAYPKLIAALDAATKMHAHQSGFYRDHAEALPHARELLKELGE